MASSILFFENKIPKMKSQIVFLIILFITHLSCKENDELEDSVSTEAGYVAGQATDSRGNSLSGVKIYVDNSIFYNSGILATTNEDGIYKVKTPQGLWKVYAEMEKTYNGITYKIDLDPDTFDSFPGEEGAIRNFTWRLTGEKPFNPGSFYGGLVKLYKDPDSDIYDMHNIEFTFTPVCLLIDGTEGEVITRKCGLPNTDFYSLIHDIPIGKYKITAKYLVTGEQLKLRNDYIQDQLYELSPVLDFFGKSSGANTSDSMYLAYTEK